MTLVRCRETHSLRRVAAIADLFDQGLQSSGTLKSLRLIMARQTVSEARECELLLSLFCGAGGLDLGFEQAGFEIGLAFDKKADSVNSYNRNREFAQTGHQIDINDLNLKRLDEFWGGEFAPSGVIGGPPCQSFSQANRSVSDQDPRHHLPYLYANLLKCLNARNPVKFFVLENVKGLMSGSHAGRLASFKDALVSAGFYVTEELLNAVDYATPQTRERLFLVGFNRSLYGDVDWRKPQPLPADQRLKVRDVLRGLPEPTYFTRTAIPESFPHHINHWCMVPKSQRFKQRTLEAGRSSHRSFKTLSWDKPSITVAYGHREVHVHPECHRRLSVYEAMALQGFPHEYELVGSLSSQIEQVSEAVPPPLARSVARSIKQMIETLDKASK